MVATLATIDLSHCLRMWRPCAFCASWLFQEHGAGGQQEENTSYSSFQHRAARTRTYDQSIPEADNSQIGFSPGARVLGMLHLDLLDVQLDSVLQQLEHWLQISNGGVLCILAVPHHPSGGRLVRMLDMVVL